MRSHKKKLLCRSPSLCASKRPFTSGAELQSSKALMPLATRQGLNPKRYNRHHGTHLSTRHAATRQPKRGLGRAPFKKDGGAGHGRLLSPGYAAIGRLTRDTQVRASARACAHLLADPHSPGKEMKRHRQERQICYQIFYQHKTSVGNSGNGNARGGWHSRREPGRVAREERRLAHIVEPEE